MPKSLITSPLYLTNYIIQFICKIFNINFNKLQF
nr:MAG TPA: hypothetical protein [Caudoviricetes sp.]